MMIDKETVMTDRFVEVNGTVYNTNHGSPYDRGSADSWYDREKQPHYYPQGTGNGERVQLQAGTAAFDEYIAGYDHNELFGGKKAWK